MSTQPGPGHQIGRWRLQARLGQGGFGTAWSAVDEDGREAAVKLLSAPPGSELRALARVCHPAVVGVLDGGSDPMPYLAMALVRGRPLTAFLASGAAPESITIQVGAVLADALAAVHHAGVLHGDIKPGNIVVEDLSRGRVSLVDFGLSDGSAGGTLQYAPPDRLGGGRLTPASDVYALGMVLFEMVHGHPPWPDQSLSEQLTRRRRESPQPSAGPAWLRELLSRMLALDARLRPSSAMVADAFEANGARLPHPGPELVRRRARTVHVPRPEADRAIEAWLTGGGVLALVGEQGSGRTHQLDRAVRELQARGLPGLRITRQGRPWGAIAEALQSPVLVHTVGMPSGDQDPGHSVQTAAALLEEAAPPYLGVVVDDWDLLDPGSRDTIEALARRGTLALLVSCAQPPDWAGNVARLSRLDRAGLVQLASDLLGRTGDLDRFAEALYQATGGLPAPAVDWMVAAVSSGAVIRRSHRWLVDEERLDDLVVSGTLEAPRGLTLPPETQRVASLTALHDAPLGIERLRQLTGQDPAGLRRSLALLREARLVRVERGRVQVVDARSSRRILASSPDLAARHRELLGWLLDQDPVAWERLGPHLAGAADPALIRLHGPACLAASSREDPRRAGRLAESLWRIAPSPALAAACVEALVDGGRPQDAPDLGGHLAAGEEAPWRACLALARAAREARRDTEEVERLVQRARDGLGDDPAPLELLVLQVGLFKDAERYPQAIQVARTLVDRPPPDRAEDLEHWLMGHVFLGQCLEQQGRRPEALSVLESVPATVGLGSRGRASLDSDLGRLLWGAGRVREAGEVLARAARQDSGLTLINRARTLNNAAVATYSAGDRTTALTLWEDGLLMFERLNEVVEQVRIQVNLCHAYREVGRWERARQSGVQAFETARRLGQVALQAHAASNLASLRIWRDEPDLARPWLDTADGLVEDHELTELAPELARLRAELAALAEGGDALTLAQRAVALAARQDQPLELARAQVLELLARVRANRSVDVDRDIAAIETPVKDLGAAADLAELRLAFAQVYLLAGRRRDALAQVARVVVYADEVGHVALRIRADQLTAQAGAGLSQGLDDRSELLLDLAVAVTRHGSLDTLLDAIVDGALRLLEGTRAFVVLEEHGELRVAAARHVDDRDPGSPSMTIVRRAIDTRSEVIAADLGERGDLRAAQSVLDLHLGSVMCVPLIDGETALGAVVVDSPQASEQELMQTARLLRALAAHAAVAVNNARHLSETAARARWAAEVAHDIRGPVAAMMTIATELRSAARSPEWEAQALQDVVELGQRVLDLTGSLLGRPAVALRVLDLAALAASATHRLARQAAEEGLRLVVEAPEPCWIRGDRVQLGRVLANLLGNARKYSPAGAEVVVTVDTIDDQVELTVRDHGVGIRAEELEAVFGSGVQGQDSLPGHGLGLAIARSLIEEQGGAITASNHPGGGTLMRLCFPRAVPATKPR